MSVSLCLDFFVTKRKKKGVTIQETNHKYILKANEEMWLSSLDKRHYRLKLLFDFDTLSEGLPVWFSLKKMQFICSREKSL